MRRLPPERLTARHLNPDFVPRARYDQLVAERDLYQATSLALGVERDALVAENQQLRDALEHYGNADHWSADVGDVYTTYTYDGGEALPWKVARSALAGTPSEDT